MSNDEPKQVTIYTDGICVGNPGPGGYGVILEYGKHGKELSDGFRWTTNHRMELMAAIVGLEALKAKCKITLYTDSELLAKGLVEGWAEKWRKNSWRRGLHNVLNADLWKRLLDLIEQHEVKIIWIKGHAGNPANERVDALSNQAALYRNSNIDTAYEQEQPLPEQTPLLSWAGAAVPSERIIVELDGKRYTWDGISWLGDDFLKPAQVIIGRLNDKLANHFDEQDQRITNTAILTQRAKRARENRQFSRAEKLARRILTLEPENHSGLAILCASLREKGLPQQALDDTEPFRTSSNPALLTSRAAAYCDLGQWENAKRTIGQALAIQSSEEAFLVVKRIKAAKPGLYR